MLFCSGIEHLQQGGRGIATKIHADLVDFVEHEDRIAGAGLFHALNHAAGQRADIGPAMAADFGLVPHAAQTDADELAAQCAGDRFAQRCFADARRAHEAENRAFHLFFQLSDGEILEDAFLDLFQVVVVFVQDLGRGLQVEVVLRFLGPRQFDHPFQIGSDRGRFRRIRVHFFQPLELLFCFLQHLLGHLGVFDALAEFRDFLRPLVQLAEFLLNRLQLLAQKIFALGLVHLALGLGLNFLLHGEDFDFLRRGSR